MLLYYYDARFTFGLNLFYLVGTLACCIEYLLLVDVGFRCGGLFVSSYFVGFALTVYCLVDCVLLIGVLTV